MVAQVRRAPPQVRRPDFNQSLIHLTKERKEAPPTANADQTPRVVEAFEVLKEILASGVVRGSNRTGFIKGQRTAACFTEVPCLPCTTSRLSPERSCGSIAITAWRSASERCSPPAAGP